MARYPQPGEVKTRLGATIGAERAAQLYRAFLQDIDARFHRGPRALVWLVYPPGCDFAPIVTAGARCIAQVGEDLGARMRNSFRLLLGNGFDTVLLIGSDVPHVQDEWLDAAEGALNRADVVLGPTEDGGYYLVAMREPHDIFAGVQMSTPRVLRETMHKAKRAGLRVHLLPQSFDVDDQSDLAKLSQLLEREGVARLPHTTAILRAWAGAASTSQGRHKPR